jgi:benzoyl-CoA reductase/2-hydroxyglutaryl-CoA dehydratase subunit BcrC/BadD/HgdB
MEENCIKSLRNELLFKLNLVGSYETHKELWDSFYKYEEALNNAITSSDRDVIINHIDFETKKYIEEKNSEFKNRIETLEKAVFSMLKIGANS